MVFRVNFNVWPIPGPRIADWCVDFVNRRRGGAIDHLRFWVFSNQLYPGMWGMREQDAAFKNLDLAGSYDGLDIPISAGLGHLMRRARLIEFTYSDRGPAPPTGYKPGKGGTKGSAGAFGESNILMGRHRLHGDVVICPGLFDYITKETEREASVMKQVRKAREAREMAAKNNKKQEGDK